MNLALKKYTRKGLDALKKAVVELDEAIFGEDSAMGLSSYVPLEEEIRVVKAFDGKLEELDDASKFVYYMKDVPIFDLRCKYVVFEKDLPEKLSDIKYCL